MTDPALASFAALGETEQRAVAERLLAIEASGWRPFWCPRPDCDGSPHPGDPRWAHNHARADQRLPPWQKAWVVAILSGRGSGKTTTGVEFTTLCARKGVDMALVGRRGTEILNTHVRTLIERAHPEFMPTHWASKDIIEWPNGATTFLFSGEKPENIRSINVGAFWIDEAAFIDDIETVWMNLQLATRISTPGNPLHGLITSTPQPTPWMMRLEDDDEVEVRRVSTYANRANLSADFLRTLEREYEGTRMGRQELHGEVLRDVEGALWTDDLLEHRRIEDRQGLADLIESMDDIVVGVDPAGSKGKRSDATGIIVTGRINEDTGHDRFYVLGDATIKGSPTEWARQVFKAARTFRARRIVVERNFGADMVRQTLSDFARLNPEEATDEDGMDFVIKESRAVTGKETRAEPVVARYEQKRVWHCPNVSPFGDLAELEKEMTTWVPKSRGGRMPSPNRVDALVWSIKELETSVKFRTAQAGNSTLGALKRVRRFGTGL